MVMENGESGFIISQGTVYENNRKLFVEKNWGLNDVGLSLPPSINFFFWNGWRLYEDSMLIDMQYINRSIQTEIRNLRFCAFVLVRAV